MRKSAPYLDGSAVGGISAMRMDYLGGFHYQGTALKFFPTAEGYVQKTGTQYSYVYNYADHLGNIRLSYARDPQNPDVLKIIEENHYYPFGLKHTNYNSDLLAFKEKDPGPGLMLKAAPVNPGPQFNYDYKYNGKEFQDEMGMNWYDYGARNYDPAIGRWMNVDPLAEKYRRWSPYNYCIDNPMRFVDPDGMRVFDWRTLDGKNKVYDEKKREYTKYATQDDKKYGEKLRNSGPEGAASFKTLVNSPTKISVEFHEGNDGGELSYHMGETTYKKDSKGQVEMAKDSNGTPYVVEAKIDIWKNDNEKFTNDAKSGKIDTSSSSNLMQYQVDAVKAIQKNNSSADDVITANVGHEIRHTTALNVGEQRSKADYEKRPWETTTKIINELGE